MDLCSNGAKPSHKSFKAPRSGQVARLHIKDIANLFRHSSAKPSSTSSRRLTNSIASTTAMANATKTALITGCSDDGIGSGLAQALQARNIHVFATARTPAKMSQLASLDNVTLLRLDVTNAADIAAAVQAVTAATGGTLDYLINNAGRNHFMPILDEDVETLKALWEVNVWGPLAVTKAFAPLLVREKGMMVFITSTAGHLNVPYMGQ